MLTRFFPTKIGTMCGGIEFGSLLNNDTCTYACRWMYLKQEYYFSNILTALQIKYQHNCTGMYTYADEAKNDFDLLELISTHAFITAESLSWDSWKLPLYWSVWLDLIPVQIRYINFDASPAKKLEHLHLFRERNEHKKVNSVCILILDMSLCVLLEVSSHVSF